MKARLCGLSFWAFSMVALLGISPALAHADYSGTKWTIDFYIDRDLQEMVITLGTPQGGGYYNVTALSGVDRGNGSSPLTLDGTSFMNLIPAATDNLFNPASTGLRFSNPPLFDEGGIAYFDRGSPQPFALYYNSSVGDYQVCEAIAGSCIPQDPFSGPDRVAINTITENPEPSSWLLVGSGLPLLLYFCRKRNRRSRLSLL